MNTEEFMHAHEKINVIYSLKDNMHEKIVSGKIWTDADKKALSHIKNSAFQAIVHVFQFCENEKNHDDDQYASLIADIKLHLQQNFQKTDSDSISLSDLNLIVPTLGKLHQYIHDRLGISESVKDTQVSQEKNQNILADTTTSSTIKKTFTTIIRTISGATRKEKQQKKEKKQVDVKISDDIEHVADDIHLLDDEVAVPEISKRSYFYRLIADFENLLTFINISEEITEANYENIFEEYKDYLLAHEQRKKFEKILGKRLTTYKSYRSRTGKKHRMGEAMIFIKEIFDTTQKEEEPSSFDIRKQELQKKAEEEKALLRKQSIHFPHIIQLLEQFKTTFKAKYFTGSPAQIRTTFVQQYDILVLHLITQLDPELLAMDNHTSADYKHWKYELYKGIPSLIQKGSDELIEKGVEQGFIFGEIDDLIDQLQNIYNTSKSL